ncbi:MAG: PAS domain-containing sensor histidine kinase [Cytophagales bacterium]|nr:PAS domain-containing sensor histidine kinase [Cytophagales bacterium]
MESPPPFLNLPEIPQDAFREIFQSMTEGIVVVNARGSILVVNPIGEEMFGYQPGELVGKSLENLVPERYRGKHLQYRESFNAKPTPRQMGLGRHLTALRKNGQEFPVEISLSHSKGTDSFMAIAFISDITLRKNAEEALRQSEEQLIVYASELEKKVKSRTEDLNASVAKLEREVIERKKAEEEVQKALERERELNEMKTKFVSIASHEFRTPLSAILSSISLIDQYRKNGDLEKIDKHIQRARTSVNHLTSILNDFLSVGKLEEGKVEIARETVDVRELFLEITEELKLLLKSGQNIELGCSESVSTLLTDVRMLRNILFNLLSNASKYSGPDQLIVLNCEETPSHLIINIKDQGIGIPKEEQKHLFDRFFRASNATNIQGTGLGLNIVKRYLELLNGTISYTSDSGKGSTFTINLPR